MATVMIVEDSPTVRTMMERFLVTQGHEVVGARDSLAAMAELQVAVPDIMLLDIMLPGVGGIELCMTIRRNPAFKNMPIIMVTSIRTQTNLARHAGAEAYIVKPFTEEKLLETINHHLAAVQNPSQPMIELGSSHTPVTS